MAEETKNWLTEFGDFMGGASDTVRNVAETFRVLTEKQQPFLPASLPEILRQMKEQKDVQAEVESPAASSFANSPWLPIAVVGVLLILMVKS